MKTIIGALEQVNLPELELQRLTVRVDTGATTSCLHVDNYRIFTKEGKKWVEFSFKKTNKNYHQLMPLLKNKKVISSNGKSEYRPVIESIIQLGNFTWRIELTLTNRNRMRYPMLLGRQAIGNKFLVDPSQEFLCTNKNERNDVNKR